MTEAKDMTNNFMASLIINDFVDDPELSASSILNKLTEAVKDDKDTLFKIHNHLSREGIRNEEITELYHTAGNLENFVNLLKSDINLKQGLKTTGIYYDVTYTISTDYIKNFEKEFDIGKIEVKIKNAKNEELIGTYYSYFHDPEAMKNASLKKKDEWLLKVIENKGFERVKESNDNERRLP